eukprot:gb/GECH01000300.1/.p1 GENE.gb/GECH01000300.1/~~gb/GECH01000300.1/.p1  ORF type:complete len:310 (+),score=85.74 gb/GECH01000300.1/:1-930(+)
MDSNSSFHSGKKQLLLESKINESKKINQQYENKIGELKYENELLQTIEIELLQNFNEYKEERALQIEELQNELFASRHLIEQLQSENFALRCENNDLISKIDEQLAKEYEKEEKLKDRERTRKSKLLAQQSGVASINEIPDSDKIEMNEPAPLVTFENGRLGFGKGLDILKRIRKPVRVVCVAGPYRSGKSLIMNLINDTTKEPYGFSIGSSERGHTKGIWLWNLPKEDKESALVLLDTEGLSDPENDANYDNTIGTLSVLLSSFFIFNMMRVVDSHNVNLVSILSEITRHIRIKQDEASEEEVRKGFP